MGGTIRGVKKRAFNLLSIVSTILLCATIYAWTLSQWVSEGFVYNHLFADSSASRLAVQWNDGELHLSSMQWQPSTRRLDPGLHWVSQGRFSTSAEKETFWNLLGFHYEDKTIGTPAVHVRLLTTPLYAWAIGFSLLPLLWLYRRFRRRPAPGLCPTCGYDLRASPERCPECGTSASKMMAP